MVYVNNDIDKICLLIILDIGKQPDHGLVFLRRELYFPSDIIPPPTEAGKF